MKFQDATRQGTQGTRKGRFLREQVYGNLKTYILNETLPPNRRLIEEDLAAEMGTSRTPVREAIQKLEKEGLIYKLPKGGFSVSSITEEDIEEVFGVRGVLEGYAGYLATKKAGEQDILALEKIVDRMEGCLADNQPDELVRLNTEFHDILYRAAKSVKLYHIINDLRDYFYRYRIIIFRFEGMAEISLKDHREMITLMRSRQAGKVEKLIRRHVIRGKNLIKKKIKKETGRYGSGNKGARGR
jgi:DNA-binding GntR family transcriptional regulator